MSRARVSQEALEVILPYVAPTGVVFLSGADAAIGTYGDECNTTALDSAWTQKASGGLSTVITPFMSNEP